MRFCYNTRLTLSRPVLSPRTSRQVVGGPGTEALFRGGHESSTVHLVMVPAKGCMVRVTDNQEVELWDLEEQDMSHMIEMDDDVTVVATLNKGDEQAPYLLMGCK